MGYYCKICKKTISEEVYYYSMKVYKKPLCMTHQKLHKIPPPISKSNYESHIPKTYKNSKSTPQAMALYSALRKRGIKCKLEAYDGYKHVDIAIEWG